MTHSSCLQPSAMAFSTAGASAGGSGRVTASPSALQAIAVWIRLAWLPDDGSAEYLSVTLSLPAAAFAPFWMMSQKVSPGAPWVIMAIVMFCVLAFPALIWLARSAAFLPPVLLHAAAASARPTTAASHRALRDLNMRSPRGA